MKHIIFSIFILLAACQASPVYAEGKPLSVTEHCTIFSDYAGTVMQLRQTGYPAKNLLNVLNQREDNKLKPILKEIIIKAYNRPRFSTKHHSQRSVEEFSNEIFMDCYKEAQDKHIEA